MSLRLARVPAVALSVLAVVLALATPAGAVRSGPLTWHKPKVVDLFRGGFVSVSCVSTSFCLAGDQNGKILRYDGHHWSTQAVVSTEHSVVSNITCVTTTFCVAGLESREGSNAPLTYRNGKWQARHFAEHNGTAGVDCARTHFCVTLNSDGSYQTYDGRSWSGAQRATRRDYGTGDVSCATKKFCIATDSDRIYRYNGTSWSAGRVVDPGQYLASISCPTRAWCLAVDNRGRSVRYAHGKWHAPQAHARDRAGYTSIDCVAAGRCTAVDHDGRARSYSHGTWHGLHRVVTDQAEDVSCANRQFCVAVSYFGEAATMTAAGWHHESRPDLLSGSPTAVSCASATSCVVVDANDAWLRYDGSSWTKAMRVSDHTFDYFAELDCPTTSFCMGLTYSGRARALRGNHWTHALPTGVAFGDAISCQSPRSCIALGVGPASVWDGSRWNIAHSTKDDRLVTISCTRNFCLAGTTDGSVVTYRRGHWSSSPHRLLHNRHRLLGVSCARVPFCMAYGAHGQAFKRIAGRWSPAGRAFKGARRVNGMSCTSRSFCVATSLTAVSTYDGHSWTTANRITKEPGFLSDISCVARTLCVALTENTDSAIVAD